MLQNLIMACSVFILFIAQTTFHNTISIGDIAPNLMLILICCVGFIKGKKTGMFIGFFSGILVDIFYGYSGVIGLTALAYTYLGYVNGLFNEIFYTDDICIPVILTMASDLIYNFVYYCVTFLLRGKLDLFDYFKAIMFPEMIYTACIAVFAFRFFKVVFAKLEKIEKRGEEKLVKGDMGDIN